MAASSDAFDVIVVGGGVAGLIAARSLQQRAGVKVCLVEAHKQLGGRVRQVEGVAPWPLEAGPEFVHGGNNHLVHILRNDVGMALEERAWPDAIFWGDERRMADADTVPMAAVDRLMFEELPNAELPPEDQDISVKQWMQTQGASARDIELADVCYANDFGTSLRELGLTEAILEARSWDSGEEYLLKDRSFAHLIAHLARGVHAKLSWPVRSITWVPQHGATVSGPDGQVLTGKAVICAVPLRQLQKGAIAFEPALSAAKLAALRRVRMLNAIKVWAVFSQRFWPEEMWDVVCTHRLFPEFWMCRYKPEERPPQSAGGQSDSIAQHCITAFVCGDRARKLATHSAERMVQLLVQQVDEVLGGGAAAKSFVRGAAIDWSKEEFIEGGYSSPSLGAHAGDRNVLASAEGDVLFFAGEHTHAGINPCLQGAMETGDRAAAQVLHAFSHRTMHSRL